MNEFMVNMQLSTLQKNQKINNVVCTADLKQSIDIKRFPDFGWGIYDLEIYGGRCGYIKSVEMEGKVTIFPSGKMISIGTNSVKKAKVQIYQAIFYLKKGKFILGANPKIKIQNIVGTINFNQKLPLRKLTRRFPEAVYEPEKFPGMILKNLDGGSYLIFNSGKVLVVGSKSDSEFLNACSNVYDKIQSVLY